MVLTTSAYTDSDGTAHLWDVRTGSELALLLGHRGTLTSAAFSPDGSRLLTASRDKTARLWEAQTGKESAVLRGHEGEVTSAVFSPDGSQVLTASWDQTTRVWPMPRGQSLLDRACELLIRPLTYAQRDKYFLQHLPNVARCGLSPSR